MRKLLATGHGADTLYFKWDNIDTTFTKWQSIGQDIGSTVTWE